MRETSVHFSPAGEHSDSSEEDDEGQSISNEEPQLRNLKVFWKNVGPWDRTGALARTFGRFEDVVLDILQSMRGRPHQSNAVFGNAERASIFLIGLSGGLCFFLLVGSRTRGGHTDTCIYGRCAPLRALYGLVGFLGFLFLGFCLKSLMSNRFWNWEKKLHIRIDGTMVIAPEFVFTQGLLYIVVCPCLPILSLLVVLKVMWRTITSQPSVGDLVRVCDGGEVAIILDSNDVGDIGDRSMMTGVFCAGSGSTRYDTPLGDDSDNEDNSGAKVMYVKDESVGRTHSRLILLNPRSFDEDVDYAQSSELGFGSKVLDFCYACILSAALLCWACSWMAIACLYGFNNPRLLVKKLVISGAEFWAPVAASGLLAGYVVLLYFEFVVLKGLPRHTIDELADLDMYHLESASMDTIRQFIHQQVNKSFYFEDYHRGHFGKRVIFEPPLVFLDFQAGDKSANQGEESLGDRSPQRRSTFEPRKIAHHSSMDYRADRFMLGMHHELFCTRCPFAWRIVMVVYSLFQAFLPVLWMRLFYPDKYLQPVDSDQTALWDAEFRDNLCDDPLLAPSHVDPGSVLLRVVAFCATASTGIATYVSGVILWTRLSRFWKLELRYLITLYLCAGTSMRRYLYRMRIGWFKKVSANINGTWTRLEDCADKDLCSDGRLSLIRPFEISADVQEETFDCVNIELFTVIRMWMRTEFVMDRIAFEAIIHSLILIVMFMIAMIFTNIIWWSRFTASSVALLAGLAAGLLYTCLFLNSAVDLNETLIDLTTGMMHQWKDCIMRKRLSLVQNNKPMRVTELNIDRCFESVMFPLQDLIKYTAKKERRVELVGFCMDRTTRKRVIMFILTAAVSAGWRLLMETQEDNLNKFKNHLTENLPIVEHAQRKLIEL